MATGQNAIHAITIVVLLSASFAELTGAAESVSETRITFSVKYADGAIHNMVAKYAAYVEDKSHNTGSASHGLTHLQDTRRCVMSMYSWIQRDVCITSKETGDVCGGEYTKVFSDGRHGGTASQNVFSGNLNVKTCGAVKGTIAANYKKLSTNVASAMPAVVADDLKVVFALIREKPNVVEVEQR